MNAKNIPNNPITQPWLAQPNPIDPNLIDAYYATLKSVTVPKNITLIVKKQYWILLYKSTSINFLIFCRYFLFVLF